MANDRMAPNGAIWMCAACGKTSRDRYGGEGSSWDESCMLNAVLVNEGSVMRAVGGSAYFAEAFKTPQATT